MTGFELFVFWYLIPIAIVAITMLNYCAADPHPEKNTTGQTLAMNAVILIWPIGAMLIIVSMAVGFAESRHNRKKM